MGRAGSCAWPRLGGREGGGGGHLHASPHFVPLRAVGNSSCGSKLRVLHHPGVLLGIRLRQKTERGIVRRCSIPGLPWLISVPRIVGHQRPLWTSQTCFSYCSHVAQYRAQLMATIALSLPHVQMLSIAFVDSKSMETTDHRINGFGRPRDVRSGSTCTSRIVHWGAPRAWRRRR